MFATDKTLVAAIIAFTATEASAAENVYLRCPLVGPSGERHNYALVIETPTAGAGRVSLVGTNSKIDMKVVRMDDTLIVANFGLWLGEAPHRFRMTDVAGAPKEAEQMQFSLNRITGQTQVDYLQAPKTTPQGQNWSVVLDAFTEKGTCSKSERAF